MTESFQDLDDEFDRLSRPEKPARPPGMSELQAYFWNEHDPYLFRSMPWILNGTMNFYWVFHPRKYRRAKRTR